MQGADADVALDEFVIRPQGFAGPLPDDSPAFQDHHGIREIEGAFKTLLHEEESSSKMPSFNSSLEPLRRRSQNLQAPIELAKCSYCEHS